MTDVALFVARESPGGAGNPVALGAIGATLPADVSRVRLMRKLESEGLAGRERLDRRPDRGYPAMAIRTDSKGGGSKFLDVTRNAGAMARHRGFDRVSAPDVALVALYL
jgi:hypothetical protein